MSARFRKPYITTSNAIHVSLYILHKISSEFPVSHIENREYSENTARRELLEE
jgi:hypothetical protein